MTTPPATSTPKQPSSLKVPPPPPLSAAGGPEDPTRNTPSVTATRQGNDIHLNIPQGTSVPPSGTRLSTRFQTPGATFVQQPVQPVQPPPQPIILQGLGGNGRRQAVPPRAPRVDGALLVGHDGPVRSVAFDTGGRW